MSSWLPLLADVASPAGRGIDPTDLWSRFVAMMYGASPPVAVFMLVMWGWQVRRADHLQARLDAETKTHVAAVELLRDRCEANLAGERAKFDETAERTRKGLSDAAGGFREVDRSLSEMVKTFASQNEIMRMIMSGRRDAP